MQDVELQYLCCPLCHGQLLLDENLVKCQRCGQSYPVMTNMVDFYAGGDEDRVRDANIAYYDQIAEDYESSIAAKEIFNPFSQQRIEEAIAYLSSNGRNELLIDIGCGAGNIMTVAQSYFGRVIGFDISVQILRLAQEKGLLAHRADIIKLPVCSETVDAISAFSVLHHLEQPDLIFQEAYRVLRTGGYFYADNDPNLWPKRAIRNNRLYRLLRNVYHCIFEKKEEKLKSVDREIRELAEYHHFHSDGFQPEEVKKTLEGIGFREVQVIPHGNTRSLKNNNFFTCSWNLQLYMLFQILISMNMNYQRIAPMMLIIARK